MSHHQHLACKLVNCNLQGIFTFAIVCHELGFEELIGKVCIYHANWHSMPEVSTDAPSMLSSSRSLVMVISSQSVR